MNRSKLHLLWNMAATLLLCMGFASCSQDDMQQTGGTPLPDGKYPLQVSATVGAPQSRSVGKDSWVGDGGELFAVRIGPDGPVAKYVITDVEGRTVPVSGRLYWNNTNKATVSAWFPYDAQTNVDICDQSTGFAQFDYLAATAEGQSYTAPVALQFTHKMAKVRCILKPGKGVTETDLKTATVKFAGHTSATFTEGTLTGSGSGWITPASDGEALLVPQNMTGKPLIKVSISGNDFIYTPSSEDAGNLQAGWQHSYTITVKANGIEVTAATGGSWNDNGGSENVTSKEVLNTYTSSDLKLGDYYYADGTWSDGGLRKLYSDGTMEWEETTPQPLSDKTCIGIVFHVGQHETDQSDYTATGIGQEKCHGYAVALKDATSGYCMWGVYGTELGCCPTDAGGNKQNNNRNPDIDWCGYAWTQKIITAAGGKDKLNATEQAGYPATWYAVVSYETGCNAPSNSSGWFLPSIGQMWKIYQNRSSLFGSVSGAEGLKSDDWYWSSSEDYDDPARYALCVSVYYGLVGSYSQYYSYSYVRPVLAF